MADGNVSGSAGASSVSLDGNNSSSMNPSKIRLELKYKLRFGHEGLSGEHKLYPRALAVDHLGNVIVSDTARRLIEVFDNKGNFAEVIFDDVYASIIAISPSNGNIVAACKTGHGYSHFIIFTRGGALLKRFGAGEINGPLLMTVDKNNMIIVLEKNKKVLTFFDQRGALQFRKKIDHISKNTNMAVSKRNEIFISNWNTTFIQVFSYHGIRLRTIHESAFPKRISLIRITPRGIVVAASIRNRYLNITTISPEGVFLSTCVFRLKPFILLDIAVIDDASFVVASAGHLYIFPLTPST